LEQVGPPDLVFYRRPRTNPKEKSSTRPDALDVLSRLSTRPDPAVSIIYWRMSLPPIGSSRVTSQGISLLFILGRNFWFNVNVVDVRGYSGNSSFVKCHRTESVMDVLRIDLLALVTTGYIKIWTSVQSLLIKCKLLVLFGGYWRAMATIDNNLLEQLADWEHTSNDH
jgi:hypothetical protein